MSSGVGSTKYLLELDIYLRYLNFPSADGAGFCNDRGLKKFELLITELPCLALPLTLRSQYLHF
jgi:hypothetical protein